MIGAEEFYRDRAEEREVLDRLEGEPAAMYAAALLTDHRDNGRATADEFTTEAGETAASVEVFLQEGRWVAACPFCPSAAVASKTDKRFFCHACGNEDIQGQYVKTKWPSASRLTEIEDDLAGKPTRKQNWTP